MRTFLSLLVATATLLVGAPSAGAADPLTLTIPNGPMPAATLGSAYGLGITALGGGTRPVTWSVSSGSLPPGLSVIKDWGNSSTMVTGTPTATGTYSFSLRVRDKSGNEVAGSFSITVSGSASAAPLSIANAGSLLVRGDVGRSYSASLLAAGGQQPYTWSIMSGTLPTGLSIAGNQISGKPASAGTWTFVVRVADASGQTAAKLLSIVVF